MADKKTHDLRDESFKPATSVSDTDVEFAGAENRNVMPGDSEPLVTPEPGKGLPAGQTTKQ
jgi:hypothetical protein